MVDFVEKLKKGNSFFSGFYLGDCPLLGL